MITLATLTQLLHLGSLWREFQTVLTDHASHIWETIIYLKTRAFNNIKWPPKYKSIFSFWIVCSKWKLQLTVIHVLKCNVHHRDSDLNKANACYYYTKFFHFWPLKLYSNFQVFYIIKIISNYTVPRFIRSWLCYINIKALLLFSSHFQNFQHNSGSGVSKNCLKKVKDHAITHFE